MKRKSLGGFGLPLSGIVALQTHAEWPVEAGQSDEHSQERLQALVDISDGFELTEKIWTCEILKAAAELMDKLPGGSLEEINREER